MERSTTARGNKTKKPTWLGELLQAGGDMFPTDNRNHITVVVVAQHATTWTVNDERAR